MSKQGTPYFKRKKSDVFLLVLAGIVIGLVFFAPAFWSGYGYKRQLVSQDYSPELDAYIDEFIKRETARQNTVHDGLVERWAGVGKAYVTTNLPQTRFTPDILFTAKVWHMKLLGLNTFSVDADLNVQWLRLQLKRKNMLLWKIEGICLLDIEDRSEPCVYLNKTDKN